jgi:hypothetical protein
MDSPLGQIDPTIVSAIGKKSASYRLRARSPVVRPHEATGNGGSDVTGYDVPVKNE